MAEEYGRVRQMWHLLEPLHAVVYYAPEVFEEFAALGYETAERWPSYFPLRSAPLGAPGARQVASAFYSFSPHKVAEHIPAAWDIAAPDEVLAARMRGIDRAYRTILGDRADSPELAEAAALVRRAAEAVNTAGRPLAAANAALAWPGEPHLVLWQAATILREHRGDGHLTALLTAGLDPVESLVSFAAVGAASEKTFTSRGWSEEEWEAARERLVARGLLGADGVNEAGRALRAEVERRTDELASSPWAALGDEGRDRLADLLGPFWVEVLGTGMMPGETTLGIGKV
ncbi:hypothetical protein OHA61_23185 [Streptomyces sp. NBC_00885]|uniref:SCO6745 family protein n=1 Tax=Streptomyces sp. NBC_00885 TaxID=2975857 RepID=UPI0038674988|nr:hypothetical protein OHA61_23185 [Streptomyces sp. NBC_00885]